MEFVLRIILLFFVLAVGVIIATFAWWSFQEYLRYKEWVKGYFRVEREYRRW